MVNHENQEFLIKGINPVKNVVKMVNSNYSWSNHEIYKLAWAYLLTIYFY